MTTGRRPLIGLTGTWIDDANPALNALAESYVTAVYAAGGMPIHIPCLPGEEVAVQLLSDLDGLVLTGGADVDPSHFGELSRPGLGRVCPRRDTLEIPLARAAIAADIPVLAVCRGLQVLNVAAGGTLYQDLYSELSKVLKHNQYAPRWYPTHPVELAGDTLLYRIIGESVIDVNSFHHQAIRDVAPGFKISARAPDGVIEAIELPSAVFVLGVQWHPEAMVYHEEHGRRLFQELVSAARGMIDKQ